MLARLGLPSKGKGTRLAEPLMAGHLWRGGGKKGKNCMSTERGGGNQTLTCWAGDSVRPPRRPRANTEEPKHRFTVPV